MSKNLTGILVSVGVIGIATGAYLYFSRTKKYYAKNIMRMNGSQGSLVTLMTFDEGYLRAWSKGLNKGQEIFSYQGGNYNTQGGTKRAS